MTFTGWNYGDIYDAVGEVVSPEHPALVHGNQTTSWGAFTARTNNLARALLGAGVATGDKVAFYLRNHPAYLEGVVAAFKARLTHVNINYRYVASEVRYIVDDSDATSIIFGLEFSPIVAEIHERLPNVKRWLWVEDGSGVAPPVFGSPLEPMLCDGDGAPLDITRSPDDLFFIYTGGTTGMPKGVMWRHDQHRTALLNPAITSNQPRNLEQHQANVAAAGGGVVNLPACPLMHGTGLVTAMSALAEGGTVVLLPSPVFDPVELWTVVDRNRVEQIIIVGDSFAKPMLQVLDQDPGRFDLGSVKNIASSGVMWSVEVKQGLLRHIPSAALLDLLSSTEALGFGVSVMTAEGAMETAKFLAGDKVKVFTADGREVEPGSGEIGLIARGEPMSDGYYKDREKTEAAFKTIDGVRYSIPGDFCRVEADGTLTLFGRGSSSINTAGEKVFSEEVEEMLKRYPDIDDALVVGVPDEKWGQAVTAVVELRPGVVLDEDAVRAFMRAGLAAYKTPKRIFAVPQMFRAPNGKADYAATRAHALRELGIAG